MIVNIKEVTDALSKINEFASTEKVVPGVMLDISNKTLNLCYSDGHKSLFTSIDCQNEETDVMGKVVVDYKAFYNAIANLQPSGNIKVDDVYMAFKGNLISISAEQKLVMVNEETGDENVKVMSRKKTDVAWVVPTANIKVALLDRMNYSSIFEADATDEWDIKELIDSLSRLSTEKGKLVYIYPPEQTMFVANTANMCVVPIRENEVSQEDKDELLGELTETGEQDKFNEKLQGLKNRVHFATVISTANAKSLCGVLGKISNADKVFLHMKDNYLNIFTGDDKVGIWMETSAGNRMHTGSYARYKSMNFTSYQMNFIREFLVDNIKSTINTTSSENVAFAFEEDPETLETKLVIATASQGAMNNESKVIITNLIDTLGDISSRKLNISLKVFADMLSQVKSDMIALDVCISPDGTSCIRLAEIDIEKVADEEDKIASIDDEELKKQKRIDYRDNTLGVTQYTLLSR